MRTIVIALMLVCSLCGIAEQVVAQTKSFPYEAVITDEEIYARSGPGREYYPTSRFHKGDRVTVVRHDPGGWFMIEPPPGSFSWVRQEYLKREGNHGVVIADGQVIAWVGTSFGDDHYVEQRRLPKGELVEILAEKILKDQRGSVPYFKIKPPRGEYRWIPGAKVSTSDKALVGTKSSPQRSDPFATDDSANRARSANAAADDSVERKDTADDSVAVDAARDIPSTPSIEKRPAPTPKDFEENSVASPFRTTDADDHNVNPRKRLVELDAALQDMTRREPRDWDFADLEQGYRELLAHNDTANAATRRLTQINKSKQVQAEYDRIQRLREETTRRDQQLAAAQRSGQPFVPPQSFPGSQPAPQTRETTTDRSSVPARNPSGSTMQPGREPQSAVRSQPATPPRVTTQTPASTTPNKPKFSGAGIIQRSTAPGTPRHVLLHPNGRVLAFLQSDGVDLDKYVGESMGLEGERSYRPELKSDLLIVRGLQPVRLKP